LSNCRWFVYCWAQ